MKSGIFLVDKPQNMSSNQLVQKVKHQFNLDKVGHAGTLDPLATGVMVILVNQATKLSDLLLNETKQYSFTIQLYSSTTTDDCEGEVVDTMPNLNLSREEIEAVVKKYNGYIYDQVPPKYSAIKKNGKKLYEYARQNQVVEIEPRKVEIIEMKLVDYNQEQGLVSLVTTVSKGTYIRSLAVDMARDLKTVGHITNLVRLASGSFQLSKTKQLEQLVASDLIPSEEVIQQLDIANYELDDEQYAKVVHGAKINLDLTTDKVFLTYNKVLVALYGKTTSNEYACLKNNLG